MFAALRQTKTMDTIELNVGGMSCQNCVRHVKEALEKVPGVASATVSLEDAKARVQHEGADAQALVAAVEEEGYEASVR